MTINSDIEVHGDSIKSVDISELDGTICREVERLKLNKEKISKVMRLTHLKQISLANEAAELAALLMEFDLSDGSEFFVSLGDPNKDAILSKYIRVKEFKHDISLRFVNSSGFARDLGEALADIEDQIENSKALYAKYSKLYDTVDKISEGKPPKRLSFLHKAREVYDGPVEAREDEARDRECEQLAERA